MLVSGSAFHCIERFDEAAVAGKAVRHARGRGHGGDPELCGGDQRKFGIPMLDMPPDGVAADERDRRADQAEETEHQPAKQSVNPGHPLPHARLPPLRTSP